MRLADTELLDAPSGSASTSSRDSDQGSPPSTSLRITPSRRVAWDESADEEAALKLALRDEHLLPQLTRQIRLLGCVCVLVLLVLSASHVASHRTCPELTLLLCSLGAALGMMALPAAASRLDLSLDTIEFASVLLLGVFALAPIGCILAPTTDRGTPLAMRAAVTGRGALVVDGAAAARSEMAALRGITVIFYTAVFVPLRPGRYAVVLACHGATAAVFVTDALLGASAQQLPAVLAAQALLLLAACFGGAARRHVYAIDRAHSLFHARVQASIRGRFKQAHERAQARVALAKEQAGKEARSKLIRIAMHDLRSPLLSIANTAALMREMDGATPLSDEGVTASIATLELCSELMEGIVSDMLDYERIDSGRLVLVPAPFSPRDLLDAGLATFSAAAQRKGVRLSAEPIPADLAGLRLVGDLRRLQQCLNNGLSNAAKFTDAGGSVTLRCRLCAHKPELSAPPMPAAAAAAAAATPRAAPGSDGAEGGRMGQPKTLLGPGLGRRRSTGVSSGVSTATPHATPELTTATSSDGAAAAAERDVAAAAAAAAASAGGAAAEWVRLSVSVHDTGHGLTPAELKVLQRGDVFAQVGKGQLQGNGGTGLGLSITRQLLKLHHGSVLRISSEGEGKGTTFEMRVNCLAWRVDGGAVAAPAAPALASPPTHTPADGGAARALGAAEPAASARASPAASSSHAAAFESINQAPPACPASPKLALATAAAAAAACALRASPTIMRKHSPQPPARAARTSGSWLPSPLGGGARTGGAAHPDSEKQLLSRGRARVLHAEDDRVLQKTIALRVFKKAGVEFEQVVNGREAVEAVRERGPFDLIVLDNQMPEMTGTAAVRELRRTGYTGLVVGLTGDPPGAPEVAAFLEAGLDECLGKDSTGIAALGAHVRAVQAAAPILAAEDSNAPSTVPSPPTQTLRGTVPLRDGAETVPQRTETAARADPADAV